MASVSEIYANVSSFLAGEMSLEEFEDLSVAYAWNIHQRADVQTVRLARMVCVILDAFDADENERKLRVELANAIRPHAAISNGKNILA